MPSAFLHPHYDANIVVLSVLIACYSSYLALDLAGRVRNRDRYSALVWTVGGALVMGSGIWSMHFVGMLAMTLPIHIGYDPWLTLVSWVVAVAVSALALRIAARDHLNAVTLILGALVMGAGICGMHYIGMAALVMAPPIIWIPWLVAVSAVIACVAAAAALMIFFAMRRLSGWRAHLAQASSAVVMGVAISGMHYTGMAAAVFPAETLCLSANGLGGRSLGTLVIVASVVLLSITLFTSILDARMQARASGLAHSLKTANQQLQGANAKLQQMAFHDALTGLCNRSLFAERLERALDHIDRLASVPGQRSPRLAVLFLDLDGFKPINDSYGHAAGDQVLREVAGRLRHVARESDTLARFGGDEFLILLDNVSSCADAVAIAERALRAVARPIVLPSRQVLLSGSIGIAVYPDHGDRHAMLNHADVSMYAAKRAGGGTYAVFEPHMRSTTRERMDLQQALRGAAERGELQLHYQPKIDAHSGRMRGLEALVRWNHPERGQLPPNEFIPLAERFGLIVSIGDWIIEEVCRQLGAWAALDWHPCVAINLSAYQLRQPDLAERIGAALTRHRVDPSRLQCEITETVAMEDTTCTDQVVRQLSELGVELAIDDFGTGYSSLAYLRQLRVQQLKIDRAFVQDVDSSDDARAVVSAVIQLAHSLGLKVVAEGVETLAQYKTLIELGCDDLQGFYFARPMAADVLPSSAFWNDAGPQRHACASGDSGQ